MKLIPLTKEKYAIVDDDDYKMLNKFKWYATKYGNTFYAERSIRIGTKNKIIRMHREILGLTDSKSFADHKDGNGLNNVRENLRIANYSQNNSNKSPKRNGVSKFLGVSWEKNNNKWKAQIMKNGNKKHLGYFNDEKQAAIVYNEAAKRVHGEFARLNIIDT